MYLAHTRPDLAYTLSIVNQFMHNLSEQYMNVVTHILRYLKSSPGKGILFSKNTEEENIDVYTDADWLEPLMIEDRLQGSLPLREESGNMEK